MDEEANLCGICRKPKKSKASASITQWISTCVCDMASQEDLDLADYEVCDHCGKRIGEARKGSFTQFIFRPEFCSCQRPKARIKAEFDFYQAPSSESDDDDDRFSEDLVIEMDRAKFPVDRYKPFRLLGEGSGGSVYLCRDLLLSKNVAVKTLHTMQDSQLLAFQEEAKATSRLNHPSIIKVFDFGITEGQVPYMVLEYFKGESLSDFLKARGALDWRLACAIAEEICSALSYSHGFEIFHRDIKPDNILIRLDADGFPGVKIIDFGVALVGGGESDQSLKGYAGTPAYMSPDQLSGFDYDERSEVYSLGCTVFELLTGTVPYEGQTAVEMINQHFKVDTPGVDQFVSVPKMVSQVVSRAMCKDRLERYSSTNEFKLALEETLQTEEGIEESAQAETRAARAGSGKKAGIIALVLLMGAVLGLFKLMDKKQLLVSKPEKTVANKTAKRTFDEVFTVFDGVESIKVSTRLNIYDRDLALLQSGLKSAKPIILDIETQSINGDGFKYLESLPVKELKAGHCKLKDSSAAYLTRIKTLRSLNLTKTSISDAFLENLGTNDSIDYLDLSSNRLTAEGLKCLARVKNLKYLNLGSTGLTDDGLAIVSNLFQLGSLAVSHNKNISSNGIEKVSRLPMVAYLDLSFCPNLDRKALQLIADMPALRRVHFGGYMNISPADFLVLNKSNTIEVLALYDMKSMAEYIPYIVKLRRLRSLTVAGTDLADKDLPLILKLPNLVSLNIKLSPHISRGAMEKLRNDLPRKVDFKSDVFEYSTKMVGIEELMLKSGSQK